MTVSLDSIRDSGPYEVLCSQCGKRFGYAAPHPFDDRILLDLHLVPKSQRTGGYADLEGYRTPGDPIGVSLGYAENTPEWRRQSKRRIIATGDGRYSFRCGCGNAPVLKDASILERYIATKTSGRDAIVV